ncbi:ABC transporter ATP-binding protein [Alkalihalobacillus pseudalcaliphilus]|uniref:ABC transporter ATP-binding protein n=1 Tax=Alkalihalobacillus pseudalcaliphilus TaxID=79884 RepID=UPI00064E1430|nr:ABC transporter ATP-binding protein [Alkalihalobacillus pseudalcaliphilus]KMK76253.1 ABC transporter ATP-binding protein [Alkalihalobacillus pseudalcaliphilus]
MNILTGHSITKRFGEHEKNSVYALKSVDVTFEKGSFTAIMGTSGSGKSTLLNIISGLDKPTKGSLFFNDINLNELDDHQLTSMRNKYYGFIFQYFHLIPVMNVIDNITLPKYFTKEKQSKNAFTDRAMSILNDLGIRHLAKSFPAELSGGQQQRVAIARALINQPEILLADEPTGSLDSNTSTLVMKQLQRLNTEHNQTIITVTHDANVAAHADRVLMMHDGYIVKEQILSKLDSHETKVIYLSQLLNGIGREHK